MSVDDRSLRQSDDGPKRPFWKDPVFVVGAAFNAMILIPFFAYLVLCHVMAQTDRAVSERPVVAQKQPISSLQPPLNVPVAPPAQTLLASATDAGAAASPAAPAGPAKAVSPEPGPQAQPAPVERGAVPLADPGAAQNDIASARVPASSVGSATPRSETPYGHTATEIPTYMGPRGGVYHYSKSGKKVYERKRR
jgi:hypothetical protein